MNLCKCNNVANIIKKNEHSSIYLMIIKSISSLSVVVILSFAHVACCLMPLFAIASGSVPYFYALKPYVALFTGMQLFMVLFIGIRLALAFVGRARFHTQLEKVSYQIGMMVAVTAVAIGHFEPFKTENQKIAEQQFQFFKSHRSLHLDIAGSYDSELLRSDISKIRGIRSSRIPDEQNTFSITYQIDLISKAQVLHILRQNGYDVTIQE